MWNQDDDFTAWLDEEDLGTDDEPLDDHVLDMMYRAWLAGYEFGACLAESR